MARDYSESRGGHDRASIVTFENYGRHVNTALPFITALALRDWVGLKQLVVITVVGVLASHGPKRFLNDVEIMGTRLGQRPHSTDSRHNMPSGHSTLAGACAYFMVRRYSIWFGIIVIPVLLFTMYVRFMLDMHTISATISGAGTGILVSAIFATTLPNFNMRLRQFLRLPIRS
tara:strand:- start:872 stop:1393 length:522 start_codon:yes stop_codon:yes gene_type:complete